MEAKARLRDPRLRGSRVELQVRKGCCGYVRKQQLLPIVHSLTHRQLTLKILKALR